MKHSKTIEGPYRFTMWRDTVVGCLRLQFKKGSRERIRLPVTGDSPVEIINAGIVWLNRALAELEAWKVYHEEEGNKIS